MARLGLGKHWQCLFANDSSPLKTSVYEANFGEGSIVDCPIESLDHPSVPDSLMLWASFPCQDLSLAGPRGGINEPRSGAFWAFLKIVRQGRLRPGGGAPLIVIENVIGLLSSGENKDFRQLVSGLREEGYEIGAVVIDGSMFLPQSRKRLFLIAVRKDMAVSLPATSPVPVEVWHPQILVSAVNRLAPSDRDAWIWWNPMQPDGATSRLANYLEDDAQAFWESEARTSEVLALMSEEQKKKLAELSKKPEGWVGTMVMRMRKTSGGEKVQRAEIRFDGLANCIRTPAGGASIQRIVSVRGTSVRTRKMTICEAARLMGLPDTYKLPVPITKAYQVLGDGLMVPAVTFVEREILRPLTKTALEANDKGQLCIRMTPIKAEGKECTQSPEHE